MNRMISAQVELPSVDQLRNVLGKKWSTYPDCIGAFVAEMDFPTAPVVRNALSAVVEEGFFGYTPDAYTEEMSLATANWYQRNSSWTIQPKAVKPLPDVLSGLVETIRHFIEPGSKVIVPTPAYMPFLFLPQYFGLEHVEVPSVQVDGRWEMNYDGIEAAFQDGGGLLIICNPWNPIGRVLTTEEMIRVSEIVDRHGGRVFSDEIHAPLTFSGQEHVPYASVSDVAAGHTLTAISASKAFNLPNLKCAQLILSNEADAEVWLKHGLFTEHGASALGILANTVAYNDGQPWLDSILTYLEGNRALLGNLLATHLPEAQFIAPEGTYLAWINFSAYNLPDDPSAFFRDKANVAIVNGSACGEIGKGSIRFNFALSSELLEQAIVQMANVLVG